MIKRKIFPGWWLVLTGGILAFLGNASYLWGFSALFKPLSAELGFSRAATSVASSIGRFEGSFEAPLAGWITDKYGPRWIILAGVFLVGLALILMSSVNSLWAFYLVWGVMVGTGQNLTTAIPIRTAIANWFVKKRGTAQGIQMSMSGLSAVIGLPLITWLIISQGWRATVVIEGIVILLVALPLTWFFVKQQRPEYYGLLPDGATAAAETAVTKEMVERGVKYAAEVEEIEFTLKQALRTPAFWLLLVVQASSMMASSAFSLHGIPFLTDIGIAPLVAAGMVSMRVLVSLPMRFFGGVLTDRIQKNQMRFLLGGAYLLEAAGFSIYLLYPTTAMLYAWFIVYGLGSGIGTGINSPLKGRYFGRKAFGSITGISTALVAPVSIAAPIYFGWVYDTTGSYINAFTLAAIMLGVSAVLAIFVLPPKPPAEASDIRKIV